MKEAKYCIRDMRGRWFNSVQVLGNAAYFTNKKLNSTPSYSEDELFKILSLLRKRNFKVTYQRV